jgi:hypothetical protein
MAETATEPRFFSAEFAKETQSSAEDLQGNDLSLPLDSTTDFRLRLEDLPANFDERQ